MKDNKKYLIRIVIFVLLLTGAVGGGVLTGLFESVPELIASLNINASTLLRLAVMVFLVLVVQNIIVLLLGLMHGKKGRTNTMLTIAASMVKYIGAIVIICWGLRIFGVDVATIATSVGIVALIIGFGAESLIADVITGFFMLFENQYNVGDIVEVGGFRGTVSNIGIRTTSITDAGGNIKSINNSNMKDILNRSNIASLAINEIGVPYDLDLEEFEKKIPGILEDIYVKHVDVMASVPTYLGVSELADSAVILKFRAEVKEENIFSVQRIMNHDLFVEFKKAGVEVPFNQLDIHQKA